jgi:hypothetical protein
LKSAEHTHGLTLNWLYHDNEIQRWNHLLADIVQQFGLPGDRYVTEITTEDMTFWFRDHRDALLFRLCHGNSRLRQA